jgi:peptidoglycan/xylan/chitin deacetylase (PgdA/CDA1 family)
MRTWPLLIILLTMTAIICSCGRVKQGHDPPDPFPASGRLKGWTAGQMRTLEAGRLYEYIDGEAEVFLQYGVQRVRSVDYSNGQASKIVVDVYEFDTSLNAFGAFSRNRVPGAGLSKIGTEAFYAGGLLGFWQDRFFAKLSSNEKSDRSASAVLATFAVHISRRLPGRGDIPRDLALLSGSGVRGDTIRYYNAAIPGADHLPRGFTADSPGGRAFLAIFSDPEEAAGARRLFFSRLVRKSYVDDYGLTGWYSGRKRMLVALADRYIVGFTDLTDLTECRRVLRKILGKIRGAKSLKNQVEEGPGLQARKAEAIAAAAEFRNLAPVQWGITVKGVKTRLRTNEAVAALTFDACGGPGNGDGYDRALIDWLVKERIPATLFLSGIWVESHRQIARELADSDLFEIGNHGWKHRPLSVTGKYAYGLRGTRNCVDAAEEILVGAGIIQSATDADPRIFRPGTAHCDEVAVRLAKSLGCQVVNFNVNGDRGGSLSPEGIRLAVKDAPPGSIIIFHMNRPEGHTAQGVRLAVRELRKRGFRFVRLSEYQLQ